LDFCHYGKRKRLSVTFIIIIINIFSSGESQKAMIFFKRY